MWLDAILRVYDINREQGGAGEPMSGKGFGGGPGLVEKDKKEGEKSGKTELASETDSMPTGGVAAPPKTDRGKAGKKSGECYLHGPFLGDMLPGQTLRMKRGPGEITGMAAMIPEDGEDEDADLSDDIYSFIRRTPQPWTPACLMQVASLEFRSVDKDILRATISAVLTGMKKTAQPILMASIRNGTPHRGVEWTSR